MPYNLAERTRVIENPKLTIALPARNESANLEGLLPRLRLLCPEAEILVVDDGSMDDTAAVLITANVLQPHKKAIKRP